MRILRSDIRENGNHTEASERHDRNNLIIIAGVELDIITAELLDLCNLRNIAAGFLDSPYILCVVAEVCGCLGLDVAAGAGRHIVHDDRSMDGIRNFGIVTFQTVLCSLVVIRCHNKTGIYAVTLSLFGKVDGCICAVGTGSGDHRDPMIYRLNAVLDDGHVLLLAERRGFTGRAADHDSVCTVRDLPFKNFIKLGVIHCKVIVHGSDEGYSCTCKNGHENPSLKLIYMSLV